MTSQLTLGLSSVLSYAPEGFIVHEGIQKSLKALEPKLKRKEINFQSLFLYSKARTGKTHFSIYLSDLLTKNGFVCRLLDGKEIFKLSEEFLGKSISEDAVFIFDDIDRVSKSLCVVEDTKEIAAFISFFEKIRAVNGLLIFLSLEPMSKIASNPHIISRLKMSTELELTRCDEASFPKVLEKMLIQRGIKLNSRSISYLQKRLPRDLGSVESYISNLDYLSSVLGEEITIRVVGDAV